MDPLEAYQVHKNGDGTVTIPEDVYSNLCSNSDILGFAKEFFGLESWENWKETLSFYESQKDA